VIRTTLIPFAALALAACATSSPPEQELGAARAMVAQARPLAAADAPQQLAEAQVKLGRAEAAMQQKKYEEARNLARQAEADARLASSVAENVRAQRTATEMQDANRALRQEIERTPQ